MSQTPEDKGQSVVREVVSQLKAIFGDDHDFMYRIACVESDFGNHPNTYRDNYHGGIWQVDKIGFADTQNVASHPRLKARFEQIQAATGISWQNAIWEDLRKPIYSGIAARLLLLNIPAAIPTDLKGQAQYWKTHYNTEKGKGTVEDFISKCS